MGGRNQRGFTTFWFGQAVSQIGDEVTLLALPWLIAETTASPLAVGLLEAFAFIPVIFFGLLSGIVADRRSRRRSMLEADVARFVVFASIPAVSWLLDATSLAHVLVVVFAAGTARVMFEAASQSFLPDLVSEREIVAANAKLSTTEGTAIVAGPAVAGLMIAVAGAQTAVAIDALTFLASFAAIASLGPVRERRGVAASSLRRDLSDGLRALRRYPLVLTPTLVNGAANVASGMTAALSVFFLQRVLGLDGLGAGLVIGANGVGVIAAGVLAPRLSIRLGFGRTIVVGQWVAALGVAVYASASGMWRGPIGAAGLCLIGLGVILTVVASVTVRQRLVPGEFLGRVTAAYRTLLHGTMAVGAVIGGVVGEVIGVREGLVGAAALYILVAIVASFTSLNAPDPPELASTI